MIEGEFDEVQFPPEIGFGTQGGPMRQTQVVVTGSGAEQRNGRWVNSRRTYRINYFHDDDEAYYVLEFFEARNGRLIGFRFKDWLDFKSCPPMQTPSPLDQTIGTGSGTVQEMQLQKTYTSGPRSWVRPIYKPVEDTVIVAYNGTQVFTGWSVDYTTGLLTTDAVADTVVTAGFEFDVPVRFDTDDLQIVWKDPLASALQNCPLMELPG